MRIKRINAEQIINFIIIVLFLWQAPIIPGLMNSRRLSVIIALVVLIVRYNDTQRMISAIECRVFVWSFSLFVCFVIIFVNGIGLEKNPSYDYLVPYYMIWIFLYNFIFPLYCMVVFKNVKSFANLYILIMLFESVVIYFAILNTPFRLFIYQNFYGSRIEWNSVIANGSRVVGIYMAGSGGSLCFFAACAFLVYLYMKKEIQLIKFLIEYIVILGATMFVGRLGFYLEILLLLYSFILEKKNLKTVIYIIGILMMSVLVYQLILNQINPGVANYLSSWTWQIFDKENRFAVISIINSMEVPKMSEEMIFGTNVTLGLTPAGASMMSDSGFAKMYCGIGVIGAFIFYLGYLSMFLPFLEKEKKKKRNLWLFLIIVLFVIEYKEPFFLKCTLTWQIMVLMMLSKKEEMLDRKISVIAN